MKTTEAKESQVRLLHAVWENNVWGVRAELASGINPNGGRGMFPLESAASHGFAEIVRELLDAGASPRVNEPMPPVGAAALNGHEECLKLLLDAAPGYGLNFALRYAAMNNHGGCIEILVAAGADVLANKCEALSWAMVHGARDAIRALLAAGANLNVGAKSALRFAANHNPFTSEESSASMVTAHSRVSAAYEIARELSLAKVAAHAA